MNYKPSLRVNIVSEAIQRMGWIATSRVALLAMTTFLTSCDLSPSFHLPKIETPQSYKEAGPTEIIADGKWEVAKPLASVERGKWWQVFGDDALNALEEEAIKANPQVQAAAARVQEARANARIALGSLFPDISAGIGPFYQQASGASRGLPNAGPSKTTHLYRAQAAASYEADLFGRIGSNYRSADFDADAQAALYNNVLLALQADVAQTYFAIRTIDAERKVLRDTVGLREDESRLTKLRFDEGYTSELEFQQAQTELASARADEIGLGKTRAEFEHSLALLLGKMPAEFSLETAELNGLPPSIPAGLPSALLERRPDIASAVATLASANQRIGSARAAFFPTLSLTGLAGFESDELGNLFKWSNRTWMLGPFVGTMLSVPIFSGGKNIAGLDLANAGYTEAVATYRGQVLNAFREVEDNLAGLRVLSDQSRALKDAVTASSRSAHLADIRYKEGLVGYLDVTTARRLELTTERASVQVQGARFTSTVALIRALGGGWDMKVEEAKPADVKPETVKAAEAPVELPAPVITVEPIPAN